MDPIHLSSSANMVTCEEMCLVLGLGTPAGHGLPPPPAQLRATRPKRRGALRLQPQDLSSTATRPNEPQRHAPDGWM
eukprot:10188050-Karenia_brevis.AAC.1